MSCLARRISGSRGSSGSGSHRRSFRGFGHSIRKRFIVRHSFRPGAGVSRSYQWPAKHRHRRIHTSQPRSSRPMSRGRPSRGAGCVHDHPYPNSAPPSTRRIGPTRTALLRRPRPSRSTSSPLTLCTGSRPSARASCAFPYTAIRRLWSEGAAGWRALASAESPAGSPVAAHQRVPTRPATEVAARFLSVVSRFGRWAEPGALKSIPGSPRRS
jgi:hypothetical protein